MVEYDLHTFSIADAKKAFSCSSSTSVRFTFSLMPIVILAWERMTVSIILNIFHTDLESVHGRPEFLHLKCLGLCQGHVGAGGDSRAGLVAGQGCGSWYWQYWSGQAGEGLLG